MTREAFFAKFNELVDSPNSIHKMRGLILQLAVTGKLIHSDPNTSASELIDEVHEERTRLIGSGVIKARPIACIEQEKQPFEIPTGWAWGRLSEVGHELEQKIPDKRFTYIDVGSIDADRGVVSERVEQLDAGEAPSRARKLVKRGTVIYSTVRPYLRNIAIIERDFEPEPIASTAFGILHPFSGVDSRFLFYWLRSEHFTAYVQEQMTGMAYPATNDEKFYGGPIPIPPTAEQERIVAKVGELMALCDRLEEQQEERETRQMELARASLARFADAPTRANLNFLFHKSYDISPAGLRNSILRAAFQGDLGEKPSYRKGEHGAETVLSQAAQARRRFWEERYQSRRKYQEPEAHKSEGLPRIPAHWKWASIDSVCAQVTDGEHIQPPYQTEGFPMLSAKHVRDGHVTLEGAGWISKDAFEKSIERCEPVNGDILIVSVGATTGRSAIVQDCPPFAIVRSVLLLKPAIPTEYLHWWLKNPWTFTWMTQASGASAQPHLYIRDLKRMPVPIPPLNEQLQTSGVLERLIAMVDQLEGQLSASRDVGANLLDAVVAELVA